VPSFSDFFATRDAIPVRGRPVSFRAIRRTAKADDDTAEVYAVDVRALLQFVNESDRAEANREADLYVNSTLKPGQSAPDGAREDARALYVLFRALRNVDPPNAPLCRTVEELRGGLTRPAFLDLWAEYNRFESEEFPPYVDADEFGRLVAAAKKTPLPGLLDSFDSDFVRRSLPGLAGLLLPLGMRKSSSSQQP